MIPSIYQAVSKMNILKGELPWTYYKLPCILSWLDLSDESELGTGPWTLFHCQHSFLKIFAIFYIKG